MVKANTRQSKLRALRAFCAAARHESFKLAAEELFVTPSAISQQVKGLEDDLGVDLFDRAPSALILTAAGTALFDEIDPLLSKINEVTERFRSGHQRRTLRISVQPFFASELLMPRLSEFTRDHPEIDMQLDTSDEAAEKHPLTADVSIRIFKKAPDNMVAEAFYPLRVMAACSPALHKKIFDKRTMRVKPFPMIVHSRRREHWQLWADTAGITLPEPSRVIELDSTVAVVNAACQELGVAVVPMPLSQRLFTSGQLVPLFAHEAPTKDRYYFVHPPQMSANPAVQALRIWVLKTFSPPA